MKMELSTPHKRCFQFFFVCFFQTKNTLEQIKEDDVGGQV